MVVVLEGAAGEFKHLFTPFFITNNDQYIHVKGLAEWFSSKFTLYRQGFDYSTPYFKT